MERKSCPPRMDCVEGERREGERKGGGRRKREADGHLEERERA